jgi:hypothetical protein
LHNQRLGSDGKLSAAKHEEKAEGLASKGKEKEKKATRKPKSIQVISR